MHLEVNGEVMDMIRWTGILSEQKIGMAHTTPAQVLQKLLEAKWKLKPADKDMIVMQHAIKYRKEKAMNLKSCPHSW
jgi:saccharopine dehydrogenase-like NADP-dependent oxidoreductase